MVSTLLYHTYLPFVKGVPLFPLPTPSAPTSYLDRFLTLDHAQREWDAAEDCVQSLSHTAQYGRTEQIRKQAKDECAAWEIAARAAAARVLALKAEGGR